MEISITNEKMLLTSALAFKKWKSFINKKINDQENYATTLSLEDKGKYRQAIVIEQYFPC